MKIRHDIKSSNFAEPEKERKIEYIILHYTDQDFETSVESLTSKEKGVSAHYLIAEDGLVFNLVDDANIAWHAGTSYWNDLEALNNNSIGIEIVNLGYGPFTDIQMDSAIKLCQNLRNKYDIPRENILGHSDIAPDRKLDPGIFFDWKRLSNEGLGIEIPHHIQSQDPDSLQAMLRMTDIKKLQTNLSKIGYKIEITGKLDKQTSDVIRAFKSHFCPETILETHGIENYRNYDSRYEWDEKSDEVLEWLLLQDKNKIKT